MDLTNEILKKLEIIETMLTMPFDRLVRMTFSLKEAADYLHLSKDGLYKLTSARKIPFYKPGGKIIVFYRDELDEWLRKKCVASKSEIDAEANKYVTLNPRKKSSFSTI
jgi:excisionase family DNA binding protein